MYVRSRKGGRVHVNVKVFILLLYQTDLAASQFEAENVFHKSTSALQNIANLSFRQTRDIALMAQDETITYVSEDDSVEVNATCGTFDAPCLNLRVALRQIQQRNSSKIALFPGTYSRDGNCGLELGDFPVHISSFPGMDSSETVLNCSSAHSDSGHHATGSGNEYSGNKVCHDDLKSLAVDIGGFMIKPDTRYHISINGITITDAAGATGGGLHISGKYANVSVTNVVLRECRSVSGGGGIYVANGASVILRNVTVDRCSGDLDGGSLQSARGGGIFIEGNSTRASLENITLTNNSLNSKSRHGWWDNDR